MKVEQGPLMHKPQQIQIPLINWKQKENKRNIDTGKMSDEISANVDAIFTCETCDTKFSSRQELKEHSVSEH